jgi:amino acid adenylation domain-containing protein
MIYQLHHLLVESARRHPAKDAVVHQQSCITYGDLHRLSSSLAQVLLTAGMRKGDRVGIYLPKSIASVVSIFGILKAGGIYVPLDPFSPLQRLSYILGNCGIRYLVTSTEMRQRLEDYRARAIESADGLTFILTDDGPPREDGGSRSHAVIPWHDVKAASEHEDSGQGLESDLAYILYTSGSTGEPKGVMISHRAALTFIDWTHDEFEVSSRDVVSSHAPLHFDLSIFDIFTTIKAGGTIALVPEGISTFPVRLSQWIVQSRISVWYSVPSALTLLATRGNLEHYDFSRLRVVLFAGEVFPVKYLRRLKGLWPARMYNLYGPTETNVCTFYEIREISEDRVEPFPIGRPIPNCDVFAVNERDERIGLGETGELYVRGPGLMCGYWGCREKTEQVLLPSRFQEHFEDRIYKTGDLVRLEADGNYVYVGRRDNMVKVRGHRVELGEIESALYSHPRVKEAVVVAIPDDQVTNRLKAFVVADGPPALTGPELQAFCSDRVPRYMVPEMVEFRDILPQTSTGKIDRKSLR